MIVIRSFDVNKPGSDVEELKGGVAGGSILKGNPLLSHLIACFALGILRVGQEIEVRPGIVSKSADGNIQCRPIRSVIVSLCAEKNQLQYAVPGGLIGVGTKIDPTLCRGDRLVGHVLGAIGTLPDVFVDIEISYYLLRRLLGVRTEGGKKGAKVEKLSKGEFLMVNIGSLSTGGKVTAVKGLKTSGFDQSFYLFRRGSENRIDRADLHRSRWEDCIESSHWQALEIDW